MNINYLSSSSKVGVTTVELLECTGFEALGPRPYSLSEYGVDS